MNLLATTLIANFPVNCWRHA